KPNITSIIDEVTDLTDMEDHVIVKTMKETYCSKKAFTSIFDHSLLYKQQKYPVLQQHFTGWFIKTDAPAFDTKTLTFMDFAVPQHGNTRFMYVLPFSETEALLEYTLFSEELLSQEAYENAIKTYMKSIGITAYKITEKENGSIPMTCYNFSRHNSKNILYIGTAGGWTKPSTGYTFLNITKKTNAIIPLLKKESDFTAFGKRTRFWYYDLLLLDVLHRRNDLGVRIFSAIFRRNTPENIFRFLGEQSSLWEELKIILSLPPYPFIKSVFKRIF
ncbi:MAG: lycopene cyclase family protein, partial [Bacteroidota bacterium]